MIKQWLYPSVLAHLYQRLCRLLTTVLCHPRSLVKEDQKFQISNKELYLYKFLSEVDWSKIDKEVAATYYHRKVCFVEQYIHLFF
jgi:hypothetical protein